MGKKDKTKENSWYSTQGKYTMQLSWYNLFVKRHNIPISTIIECLDKYTIDNGLEKYNRPTIINQLTYPIQWEKLLAIITAKTAIVFKKRLDPYSRFQKEKIANIDYQNWYDQCSIDGTFAYNGVTEDF